MLAFSGALHRSMTTICTSTWVSADVSLPNIFGDHMVLQQKQKNRVWGKASPGEDVTVQIESQSHKATAKDDGTWEVSLDPLPVGGPYVMTIKGKNEVKIDDILVGEVWICSGQSNMQWSVNQANNADMEKLAAHYPKLRMINFPQVGAQSPIWTHNRQWQVTTPETVGGFSAVGYFFGRQLHQSLDVPVGMINNAWGGSACEAWINLDLLKADPQYKPLLERWEGMEKSLQELVARAIRLKLASDSNNRWWTKPASQHLQRCAQVAHGLRYSRRHLVPR